MLGPMSFGALAGAGGAAVPLDADAAIYIAAMTVVPGATRQTLINQLFIDLKAAGIYALMDEMWLLASHTEQAGLLGMKRVRDCSNSSATFQTDRGFAGNGSSTYLDTNFAPSTDGVNYTQNDASFGVYCRTNNANSNVDMGVVSDGSTRRCKLTTRTTGDEYGMTINDNGNRFGGAVTDARGMTVIRRSASNATQVYKNGSSVATGATASVAPPSLAFFIGTQNTNGSPAAYTERQFTFAFVGAAMTPTQQNTFYDLIEAYMVDIGASPFDGGGGPEAHLVAETTDQYVVGLPQNSSAFFDGTRYWIFYIDAGMLKCKFGTALSSLTATGGDLITSVGNSGRAYSCVFGQIGATWYAWVLTSRNEVSAGEVSNVYRWELTAAGLANGTSHISALSDIDIGLVRLAHNYGGEAVTTLYRLSQNALQSNQPMCCRSIANDLTGDTDMTDFTATGLQFCESVAVIELSDGYLAFASDDGPPSGDSPGAKEATKTNVGDSWGTLSAELGFTDQEHATNTSHAGQHDLRQLDNGDFYTAYLDGADAVNGDYGRIILKRRGGSQAGTWSTISSNVGDGEEAWHIAMTTDGTDIWIFWLPDNGNGARRSEIHYRKYDVVAATWGDVEILGYVRVGYEFVRMCATWRTYQTAVVVWSEHDGATGYDVMVTELVA